MWISNLIVSLNVDDSSGSLNVNETDGSNSDESLSRRSRMSLRDIPEEGRDVSSFITPITYVRGFKYKKRLRVPLP